MASDDFLSPASAAGQNLLRLVSRGNAIVAELLRLADNVPPIFVDPSEGKSSSSSSSSSLLSSSSKINLNPKLYTEIIFDFSYLKKYELYETRIETSDELRDLDESFKEAHMEILTRFYLLFESIYKYLTDFTKYIEDLEGGVFIQQTPESVLLNQDGQQLMAEAVYLYGVMLTLMDRRIEGVVRERLLMSYLRYKGHAEVPLLDEVCKLCRTTGYSARENRKPADYPVKYFARYPLPQTVIEMIIGRLRADDIYSQMQCYPLPEHRSTALANQGAMLYILLWFAPHILAKEQSMMREIVDKHFSDNWVISYYLGYTADLSVDWDIYPAAKAALANTLSIPNIKNLLSRHTERVPKLLNEIAGYLTEGILVDDYVLENHSKLMNCLRQCNVALRWLMLHATAKNKKLAEIITPSFNASSVLLLLLNTAQFEYVLKNLFQSLLDRKDSMWTDCKAQGSERMNELGEYFSGEKPLTRVAKNENLQQWFMDIATKIADLDHSDSTAAGRKIQQLIHALEEVEQFHQIEASVQVKTFLADTRELLGQMLRIVNIKEQYLVTMRTVADISYAWQIINDYVPLMQDRIKRDPSSTIKLRSTFLKLASIMELPLVRIVQINSPDLFSVSEFYSGELVSYVKKVMAIIPKSMFLILNEIIELQTNKIQELPTKLERVELKDFAQLDLRYELAKATHAVSMFTEGILAMETTLVGIIKIDPKQLLEEGIRRELVKKLATSMDRTLIFTSKNPSIDEFESKLRQLASQLDGFSRSFQYIQDYVKIHGLKLWQEEFSRIVNYNVEQECNSFLKTQIFDHQSKYQSKAIPIPRFPPVDRSVNFIGRLARALLTHTHYRTTLFLDQMSAWYGKDGRELVGIRTFDLLLRSVGVFGVTGLDKLFSFMVVKEMHQFVRNIRRALDKNMSSFLEQLTQQLSPVTTIPVNTAKLYTTALNNTKLLWPMFLETIAKIGQMQLLRRQIAHSLHFLTKLDSNMLSLSLHVFNKSLIADIQQHYKSPESHPYPAEDNSLLFELTKYLEATGIHEPFLKIYITTPPLEFLPLLLFLFVIVTMPKFSYDTHLKIMRCQKKDKTAVDGTAYVVGVITMLRQFNSLYTEKFLAYLGQYVRSFINVTLGADEKMKMQDYPPEVLNVLLFLEAFCLHSNRSRKSVEGYLPAYIFDEFKH